MIKHVGERSDADIHTLNRIALDLSSEFRSRAMQFRNGSACADRGLYPPMMLCCWMMMRYDGTVRPWRERCAKAANISRSFHDAFFNTEIEELCRSGA
jgi:hypothetical protein